MTLTMAVKYSSIGLSLIVTLATACERHIPGPLSDVPSEAMLKIRDTPPTNLTANEAILSNAFDSIEIETWSSYYAHGYHLAGKNKSMAEWTADKFTEFGISASLTEYEVLLDYPVSASMSLNYPNGSKYDVQLFEDPVAEDDTTTYQNSVPAFHGYSATGEATAEYIYVGQGHEDDFQRLVQLGVDLKGKVALSIYGGPFRGVKVKNAEANGMIGAVLFTDPVSDGVKGGPSYPDGPARQPSSLQRGSVVDLTKYPGDPTTPGYPSKPGVKRTDPSEVLPGIPSLPISYRDAIPLLQALDGNGISGKNVARDGWIGALNATYSTGPAPGATISMSNVMSSKITPIWDVIGIINGTQADETVIMGNHRDAWIIGGAADPNSGTAILVELSKAFGELLKTGWKPRRNIVLCSWDAEEYGLVGSTEWVEEYAPWLSETAISYINIDIAVSGPKPVAYASPEIRTLAENIMTKVMYPGDNFNTLYDAWHNLYQFRPEDHGFGDLGSGSDYTAFLQLGIGSLDFAMGGGQGDAVYHYHSNYDSYHWMTKFGDKDFTLHTATGQFVALLVYHLANDALIPFDMDSMQKNVAYWVRDFLGIVNSFPDFIQLQTDINFTGLWDAQKNFTQAAQDFVTWTSQDGFTNNATAVSLANQKLRDFQRAFVNPKGIPGRQFYKNVGYAPDATNGYASQTLPGPREALANGEDRVAAREQVDIAGACFLKAAEVLKVS